MGIRPRLRPNLISLLPIRARLSEVCRYVSGSCLELPNRCFCVLTLVCLLGTQLSGQAGNEAKFSLTGSVINAVTGEPIRRALVQFQGAPPRSCFTDGDGHFEIVGLPGGRFTVGAQKPGYYSNPDDPRAASNVAVTVGPSSDPVVLKLSPYGVIYGRVTNVEGEPLERIPVRLTAAVVRNGRRRWEQAGSRDTDDNGNFRFPNLQPGTFYLAAGPSTDENGPLVFANGKNNADSKPSMGYPSIYYPSAPELSSASPVALAPGQQMQTDFALARVPVYKITGSVAGYSPDQGAWLQLTTSSGDILPMPVQFQPVTGTFEVSRVPPGSYILKAYGQGHGLGLRASIPVTVATNLNNVRLTLEPVISIPIVVRKESRSNASQESTSLRNKLSSLQVPVAIHLSPVGQTTANQEIYSTLRGGRGERLPVLDAVEPGRYEVEFIPQGGWYVQSAEYAGANLLADDMTVRSGGSSPLQIVLRDDSASLEGTVAIGNSAVSGGMVVVILPQRGSTKRPAFASLDAEGNFRQDGLPPGEYLVFAAENGTRIEFDNPDAVQPYISQATSVTLSAGQTGKANPTLVRSGEAQ